MARKLGGPGITPSAFSFRWFLPSIWRYRQAVVHVLLASFFVQIFALVTPLFFQVVIDKVLSHKGYDTLFVLIGGLAVIGLFDVILQYLRTYALSHTTNRIDVELGRRLFAHLFHLPMSYFETRAAGQTVARVRELETIRSFLTGQGLFSAIDLFFTVVFIAVLLAYSWKLTLIVLFSIPLYLLIAALVRPPLREKIKEKFNRGAESQQMLVEAIVGVQTIKASAIEPAMQTQWEEKLAAYVILLLRRGAYRRGRIERHPICQQARQCRAFAVRRQGGDRRRSLGRRARRLQHDRGPGGPAGLTAVANLAGLPAGADFHRPAGRHFERSPRRKPMPRSICRAS